MSRRRLAVIGAAVLVVALGMPPGAPPVELPERSEAFRWDADLLFAQLEDEFNRVDGGDLEALARALTDLESEGRGLRSEITLAPAPPFEALDRLSALQFELAVLGAARPELLPAVRDFLVDTRVELMKAAASWSMDRETHEALYRVLFGGRMALDEALVQAGPDALEPLLPIEEVPSATPSIVVEGVRVHSGDLLLSRGGAPTSALIARGNDFPNTFSHVALAHVDAETGVGTVIESLIEAGSVLNTVEAYLESKKHRIMVLRLRPDHPALEGDPLLPHRAAESMLNRVRSGHIPYDFAMEWDDPEAAFCSEIVYHAYLGEGVDLWTLRSPVTSPGLASWLAGMGVRELASLVPSDVEYDPQVRAVVEWRDAPALMDFRLDNAIIDVLLEEAERGGRLGYPWYMLPVARVLKGYSAAQSAVGRAPAIPAGMRAGTALQVQALSERVHPVLKADLEARAADFRRANGYDPPYWALVDLARGVLAARKSELRPALSTP